MTYLAPATHKRKPPASMVRHARPSLLQPGALHHSAPALGADGASELAAGRGGFPPSGVGVDAAVGVGAVVRRDENDQERSGNGIEIRKQNRSGWDFPIFIKQIKNGEI